MRQKRNQANEQESDGNACAAEKLTMQNQLFFVLSDLFAVRDLFALSMFVCKTMINDMFDIGIGVRGLRPAKMRMNYEKPCQIRFLC